MLINALAWLFTPPKKSRGKAAGDDGMLDWLLLALLVFRGLS